MNKVVIWVHWVCLLVVSLFSSSVVYSLNLQLVAYRDATVHPCAKVWIPWVISIIFLSFASIIHIETKHNPEKARWMTTVFSMATAITSVIILFWVLVSATPWLRRVMVLC